LDPQMMAEGTVGAPTCLGRSRPVKMHLRIILKLLFTNLRTILNFNYIRQS
jgi:hypothetical protein